MAIKLYKIIKTKSKQVYQAEHSGTFESTVKKVALALNKMGFKPGSVLQMASMNHINFYWPALAAMMNGGVVSLGDPTNTDNLINQQLDDTPASAVACQKQFLYKYLQMDICLQLAIGITV